MEKQKVWVISNNEGDIVGIVPKDYAYDETEAMDEYTENNLHVDLMDKDMLPERFSGKSNTRSSQAKTKKN